MGGIKIGMSEPKKSIIDQFYPDDLVRRINFILTMTDPEDLLVLNGDRQRSIYDITAINELRNVLYKVLDATKNTYDKD